MQDSQQVCINPTISGNEIIGLKSSINTLELLGYSNKISNYLLESYLDKPVVDQIVFYLLLINAKDRLDYQIQQVIDKKPELTSSEVLKSANNFVIRFDYIDQIIRYRYRSNKINDKRVKTLAWDILQNVGSIMLPITSLTEINQNIFSNDVESGITHKRLITNTSYFEHEDNAFISYQLEEKVAECLSEINYIKNGKYTVLDTLLVLGFKERLDLYIYNLMKINQFRKQVIISYGDFKALKEFSVEFKYRASDYMYKRLIPAINRLNADPKVELYIQIEYISCTKRVPNREDLCKYHFKISLKKNYKDSLNKIKNICSKVEDESGKKLNISDSLFIAALRLNDGDSEKVIEIIKDRIEAYEVKHGPSHQAKNLNLIVGYIVQSLEDLYKSGHFFERYICDQKHTNGLMYLKSREPKKNVIANSSNATFSTEFLNIREKVDVFTSEVLMSAEMASKKSDATVIVDYNFIRYSIFKTHPHLKHQRNVDEQKYLDLVQESVKLCQVFFGLGNENERSLVQIYLTDLLFENFFEDNFHLSSKVLKNLLKKDIDYWKGNIKTFQKFWKMANEFSLQEGVEKDV